MNETLDQIFARWAEVTARYREFGARDTEPDYHFQDCLRRAFYCRPFKALTRRQWELFEGAPRAAVTAMNRVARESSTIIRRLSRRLENVPELSHQLNTYLWRIDLWRQPEN